MFSLPPYLLVPYRNNVTNFDPLSRVNTKGIIKAGRSYQNQGNQGKDPKWMGECKQRKWTFSAILQEGDLYCNVSHLCLSNSDVCLEAFY